MDAKPCEHCAEMFVPVRFATTRFCSHKCIAAQYRLDNKERIAQYRLDNKERLAQWRLDNKERIAQRTAQYRLDNKERKAERKAQYRLERLAEDPWYFRKQARAKRRRQLKRQQEAAA